MATKQFYATGSFRYQSRMLTAGAPVQMDGPTSRLYFALGKISEEKPRAARAAAPAEEAVEPTAPKPDARKRTTRRKK